MARRDSVTVSMAAETSGILSSISRVSLVAKDTSLGTIREWAGTKSTSSKVRASWSRRMARTLRGALVAKK